jgi:putative hemolysin
VKKLNFSDSAKALKIEIDFIAYSNSNEYADYSEMYLNEDGSIETSCLSKDGKKCDDLYAHVSVYKKIFPENVLAELSPNRHREQFNIHIDESNFTENFKINDFLSSIYEERLERRYHMPQRKHQMNQKDSLIPFEMCYENGFATPCNLTKKDYFRIKKAIEKERDTLVAVTYQRCFMMNDFALDGMSSKHYCNSKDGKHCSELSALVRRNDNATPNYGWLILYRFDLKDFSYTIEELSHGDPMWIDYDELYKKDGSYIGREKKRH